MHSGTANGNDGLTSDMLAYRVTTVYIFYAKRFLRVENAPFKYLSTFFEEIVG